MKRSSSSPSWIGTVPIIVYKILDAYIYMCIEYVKTFLRECVLLLSQLVHLLTNILLHVIHKPGHYDENVSYKPKHLPIVITTTTPTSSAAVGVASTSASANTPRTTTASPMSHDANHQSTSSNSSPISPVMQRIRSLSQLSSSLMSRSSSCLNLGMMSSPFTRSQCINTNTDNNNDNNNTSAVNKNQTLSIRTRGTHCRQISAPTVLNDFSETTSNNGLSPSTFRRETTKDRFNQILEQAVSMSMENDSLQNTQEQESGGETNKIKITIDDSNIAMAVEEASESNGSDFIENESDNFDEEDNDDDSISIDTSENAPTILVRLFRLFLSIVMWFSMLVWYIPSLFVPSRNHSFVSNDRVYSHEKKSTGLLEDFFIATLDFTDAIACALRLLIRFQYGKCWEQIKYAFGLFRPASFISTEGIDDRSVGQVIIDEGFPHASYPCETQDGYILQLDRIPNKKARKAVYFQHGILDSGFAWVGNGVTHSLALRAYDMKDVDVYLGNFRGYGLSAYHLKTTETFKKKDYWDYSFNEHAFYDVRAFIETIKSIKKQELGDEDFSITVVAHSMGAGTVLAYLTHSKLSNQPHHLSKAILLAPAGNHNKIPRILNILSRGVPLAKLFLSYFGFTTRTNKILVAKLVQDLNNHPALRSLLAVLVSKFIIGGQSSNSPFQYVHNLVYHIFQGTSVNVVQHFIQMVRTGRFQAYDYGNSKENMRHYGQPKPWVFLDHYHQIDPMIPVHIVYGDDDKVIPSDNVLKHARELLKSHDPDKVRIKKFTNCGHLELTFGCDVRIINYVLNSIGGN